MLQSLKHGINTAENIYDILVCLYRFIVIKERNENLVLNYYKSLELGEFEELQCEIGKLIIFYLNSTKFNPVLSLFVDELMRLLDEENMVFVAIFILHRFDSVLISKEEYSILGFKKKVSSGKTSRIGPLNTGHMEEFGLYLNPEESVIKRGEVYKNYGFKLPDLSSCGIEDLLTNYKIIAKSQTNPIVNITSYNNINLFSKEKKYIKIAVVPFSSITWFNLEEECFEKVGQYYFTISDKEENISNINDAYIQILELMESKEVDMVIFPELAMNIETEEIVRNYLLEKSIKSNRNCLKLIFLGSLWNSGSNSCTLITGTGVNILNNQKSKAFHFTDPKSGKKYYENLEKKAEVVNFIDILGLGRLSYRICKDGLDAIEDIRYWKEFGVSVEVLSSYSRSISHFEDAYHTMSAEYHGMNILANCCKERLMTPDIGFITLPAVTTGAVKHSKSKVLSYGKDNNCNRECAFCKCSFIYEVYFDEAEINDEICSFRTMLEKFHV